MPRPTDNAPITVWVTAADAVTRNLNHQLLLPGFALVMLVMSVGPRGVAVARRDAHVLRRTASGEHASTDWNMCARSGDQLAVHRIASAGIPRANGVVGGFPVS